MAYPRYRKPSYRRKRWTPRRSEPEPGLIAVLALLIVGVVRGAVWGWRRMRGRPMPPTLPPQLPSASPWRSSPGLSGPVPLSGPMPVPPPLRPGTVGPALVLPYRRRPHLMSKGERAFWYPLFKAVQGKYRLFCKVRLQDVVGAPEEADANGYWFRKIRGYHVDFVLCDPDTTEPLLAVELDDRSHASARKQERDRFKDAVLTAGGVPIYRVQACQAYDPIELAEAIAQKVER